MEFKGYIDKAKSLRVSGHIEEADRTFEEGIFYFPNEMWMYFHYAVNAENRNQPYLEHQRWRSFVKMFPEIFQGHIALCKALIRLGSIDNASEVAERVLQEFGESNAYLECKARLHESRCEWGEAIECWGRTNNEASILLESFPVEISINTFQYWAGNESPFNHPSPQMWEYILGKNHSVIGDKEIIEILSTIDPSFIEIYLRIRIPACRADIARIIYLEVNGGLYIDMHCSAGNVNVLKTLPDLLHDKEVVFFGFPNQSKFSIGNSIVLARKGSCIISSIRKSIIDNIKSHYEKEKKSNTYIPYNIYVISGPWVYADCILRDHQSFVVDEKYQDTVLAVCNSYNRKTDPIIPFYFYSYRKPGNHWSERQRNEMLFDHS